jgi:hypothetical protein
VITLEVDDPVARRAGLPPLVGSITSQSVAGKVLVAMRLPAAVPELGAARPPPGRERDGQNAEDWVN